MLKVAAERLRSFAGIVLYSPAERRLRAGWRLVLQVLLQLILTLAAACALIALLPGNLSRIVNPTGLVGLAQAEMTEVAVVTLSVFLARQLLDRRTFVSLGLPINVDAAGELGTGFGIAFLVMGLIYLTHWTLGWLRLDGFAWESEPAWSIAADSLLYLAIFVLVGWSEELMSRGYHLQTIASGTNSVLGAAIVFGNIRCSTSRQSTRQLDRCNWHILRGAVSGIRLCAHRPLMAVDRSTHRLELL